MYLECSNFSNHMLVLIFAYQGVLIVWFMKAYNLTRHILFKRMDNVTNRCCSS